MIECLDDPLLEVKLAFFESFASQVEPFLTHFQSDEPLAPYLYRHLDSLLKDIMKIFVRKEVLKIEKNATKINIISKDENLILAKDIEFPFAVQETLKNKSKCLQTSDIIKVKKDMRSIYIYFCKKLINKSPLTYKLTKGISCLDPKVAILSYKRNDRLQTALEIMVRNNIIHCKEADKIKIQYKIICEDEYFKEKVAFFQKEKHEKKKRLDNFWLERLNPAEDFKEFRKFLQIVLILSHGNASPERGFSVNKEIIVVNLREESLIAQRAIYDAIKLRGGTQNLDFDKGLLTYVRKSHQRYQEVLKNKKN